ncbi:MAG: DUF4405 domain-containing protein [Planctomycetes bacterium]|nr:DUF4405 domain-containing protein [Planctomycetota bacterium]
MKRNTLNFWIDALTFLVFFMKIWTGLLIHYILPAGQGRGRSLFLWGLNRHDYGVIHFYMAVAMIALIIVHICLHWSWICSIWARLIGISQVNPSKCFLYGTGFLFILFVITIGSLLWARSQVKSAYAREAVYTNEETTIEEFGDITSRITYPRLQFGNVD